MSEQKSESCFTVELDNSGFNHVCKVFRTYKGALKYVVDEVFNYVKEKGCELYDTGDSYLSDEPEYDEEPIDLTKEFLMEWSEDHGNLYHIRSGDMSCDWNITMYTLE